MLEHAPLTIAPGGSPVVTLGELLLVRAHAATATGVQLHEMTRRVDQIGVMGDGGLRTAHREGDRGGDRARASWVSTTTVLGAISFIVLVAEPYEQWEVVLGDAWNHLIL